jgi:hypothetical protein
MLPVHGGSGGSRGNGIPYFNTINTAVLFSVLWLLVSMCVIGGGFWHCRAYSYSFSLDCTVDLCTYTSSIKNDPEFASFTFPRNELVGAEIARVEGKNVIRAEDVSKTKRGRLGHTVIFKYKEPSEGISRMKTTKKQDFSPFDMGRREAKNLESKINGGTKRDSQTEKVKAYTSKSITVTGVLMIVFGFISLVFAAIFGVWAEANPRQLKKKS